MHPYVHDLLTLPGWLSLSRMGLAVVFPFVVNTPWLALSVVAVAAASDMLDGYVARRLHQDSKTGAALDPVMDKVFAASVIVTLVWVGRLPISGALLLSVRELGELPLMVWLLAHARARRVCAERLRANKAGKLTTALQFGALLQLLFGLPGIEWWLLATAAVGALAASTYWLRCLAALEAP